MPNSYSLTVINDSELPKPTFAVFATLPSSSSYDTLNLAWLTQQIDTGNQYVFSWDIVWGFAWSATGTKADYQWAGSGKLPANPNSQSECKADFSYSGDPQHGDFQLNPAIGTPNGDTLWIADDSSVPVPSVKKSSVAVTLDGNPACATDAGPNLSQTFTLHPTYYINAGDYVQGQMVDGSSVAAFQELSYTGGNTALTATLNQDNTWTVATSSAINFAQVLAERSDAGCPQLPTDYDPEAAGDCYSARNCGGKILNHKDAHNCKRSGGKSWRSSVTGDCYNL